MVECWCYGDTEQSAIHLYTKCRNRYATRRILRKSLGEAGIQWQRRLEKNWLAKLLANQAAVGSLLEFLENTNVGNRENAREKEIEWE